MTIKPTLKVTAVLTLLALLAGPLQAKLAWNKKARAFDAGVTACTSCHVNEKPTKKGEPLSERGEWLVQQKEKLGAKQVDLAWLKDYPNNGK
jgi:cytochrome c553